MSLPSSQRLAVRRRIAGRLRILIVLAVGTFTVAWEPAFGPVVFPLTLALGIAWFLWRSDYESGRT
jgi:hypothetical protein